MKIAIISGGHMEPSYLREELKRESFDYMIAADGGLTVLYELNIVPDVMLGDYDSVSEAAYEHYCSMHIPVYTYPSRKDFTDTELAVQHGMDKIADSKETGIIILYGATGTRLDHTMANISLLKGTMEAGIHMELRDMYNRIRLVRDSLALQRDNLFGNYISLLPFSESVEDVCLTGFRYPLQHGCLTQGNSLGISNVMEKEEGEIHIGKGYLLVIESRD